MKSNGAKRKFTFPMAVALTLGLLSGQYSSPASASECDTIAVSGGEVIWCDSFEDSDLPPSGNFADSYFDYDDNQGDHVRVTTEAQDGNYSLRQRFQAGEVNAGHLFRTFGRSPVSTMSHSQTDFREVYWRFFVKYSAGVTAFPNKLSRATIFASPNWAQAMIGHVWLYGTGSQYLSIDPASGTDTAGNLLSTQWNDFANLRWLGKKPASTPNVVGQWQCIEAHIALNTPGNNDGIFELRIDGQLEASSTNLNWVGAYNAYGINAIMLEAYWNAGANGPVDRYIDSFVIATAPIGCTSQTRPMRPTALTVN